MIRITILASLLLSLFSANVVAETNLLNVSYDVARELYKDFNPAFTIDEVFGGWKQAQKTHFADGAVFDQIYSKR